MLLIGDGIAFSVRREHLIGVWPEYSKENHALSMAKVSAWLKDFGINIFSSSHSFPLGVFAMAGWQILQNDGDLTFKGRRLADHAAFAVMVFHSVSIVSIGRKQ